MMINDDYITKKTESLLTEGENQKILLGKYSSQENEEGEKVGVIQSYREAYLPAARPVEDVVIPTYGILTDGTLNIGYLVYNSFSTEDNSESVSYTHLTLPTICSV